MSEFTCFNEDTCTSGKMLTAPCRKSELESSESILSIAWKLFFLVKWNRETTKKKIAMSHIHVIEWQKKCIYDTIFFLLELTPRGEIEIWGVPRCMLFYLYLWAWDKYCRDWFYGSCSKFEININRLICILFQFFTINILILNCIPLIFFIILHTL